MADLSKMACPRAIIFLDIDGTLIDVDQKPTAPGLPSIIRTMTKRGFCFGINSNRAWQDVVPIIRAFNLTGPFVIENGAYLKRGTRGRKIVDSRVPLTIPSSTVTALKALLPRAFPRFHWKMTDTVRLIRRGVWEPGSWFYVNRNRRFSASIHHRISGKSKLGVAVRLARELNRFFARHAVGLVARASVHGHTVTVGHAHVNKGTGIRLVRRFYQHTPIIAIGDGAGEITLRPFVDKLYAVSNAVPRLKKIADGVATSPMTAGVKEILRHYSEELY